MEVKSLNLYNFRNYKLAELKLGPGVTAIYGPNAQGKTNLLESVYFLCTGRSHRTSRDKELIRAGQDRAIAQADVSRNDGMHSVAIEIGAAGKKIAINGKAVKRSGELMGHLNSVLFSPEDLRLVKGSPGERRRFLDMEISQMRPGYLMALQKYTRAMAQRNACLRNNPQPDVLDAWDAQLAESGSEITHKRNAFITRLSGRAREHHKAISNNKETISVKYKCSAGDAAISPEDFLKLLRRSRQNDIQRGATSIGPHLDDLTILINGADARAYGSQGQQRTCVLSLKLSELMVMRDAIGEYPVLLLDDVMSELDPGRRRQLIKHIGQVQTIVTCTHPSDLSGARIARAFAVEDGKATEQPVRGEYR